MMNQSVVEVLLDLPFFLTSPGLPLSYFPRLQQQGFSAISEKSGAQTHNTYTRSSSVVSLDEVCNAYSEMYTIPSI